MGGKKVGNKILDATKADVVAAAKRTAPVKMAEQIKKGVNAAKEYRSQLRNQRKGIGAKEGVFEGRKLPEKVYDVLEQIESKGGTPPKGYKGGKVYDNNPKYGHQKLPEHIGYREYDVNPYVKGQGRGTERLVIGDDGSAWYTNNHYHSFIRIK